MLLSQPAVPTPLATFQFLTWENMGQSQTCWCLEKVSSRCGPSGSNAMQQLSTCSQTHTHAWPHLCFPAFSAVSRDLENSRVHEWTKEIRLISENYTYNFPFQSLLSFIKKHIAEGESLIWTIVKNRNYYHWVECLPLVNYKFYICVLFTFQ